MKFNGPSGEFLSALDLSKENSSILTDRIPLIWISETGTELVIDGKTIVSLHNTLICHTEFHEIIVNKFSSGKLLRFNRDFYCILNHDDEVSCKGLLIFGASELPIIPLDENYQRTLNALWVVIETDMSTSDELQLEMLQMLAKRFLILATRAYKEQVKFEDLETEQVDLIRSFNFLVEQHFRERHKVADCADLLFKSPKTLSNLFAKVGSKTPLNYIHERIAMEARRKLRHSEDSVKEIAYDLGFEDLQSFGRFFKRVEGVSPMSCIEDSFQCLRA
ncbi:MAG: helix-turn-helix domain-containing protein [Flavobacteriales bacterium]|nr:helix-turn-helix domain-containing protein [Flavobacteriales bacterium]